MANTWLDDGGPGRFRSPASPDASADAEMGSARAVAVSQSQRPSEPEPSPSNAVSVSVTSCSSSRQAAILLRYFADEIAARFDLSDPLRHFSTVVPARARSSVPLRNAILTTAARHLIRLPRHRGPDGTVHWQGHALPALTEESALHYHTLCIQELLALSLDPEQIHNEDLLAAAVILRTDEEMDAPLREDPRDQEVFLRMLHVFLAAQVPDSLAYTHPTDQSNGIGTGTGTGSGHSHSHSYSLRQAAFWVALRQEIVSSFTKQRPLTLPRTPCHAFRSLAPAPDALWADRLVLFCADVLEYCYGRHLESPSQSPSRSYHELLSYQDDLTSSLPPSFQPLYARNPDPLAGEIFPEIWHLDRCHVTGHMHRELARLLLLVHDPSRRVLGAGVADSQRELGQAVRAIVRRLCGIALSNRTSPPCFIEALMGISAAGEYFEDWGEQEALLGVLGVMRREHAFPTQWVEKRLRMAWRESSMHAHSRSRSSSPA